MFLFPEGEKITEPAVLFQLNNGNGPRENEGGQFLVTAREIINVKDV